MVTATPYATTQVGGENRVIIRGVNATRLLIPAVLLLMLLSGCTDQPKIRMVGKQAPDFTVTDADHTISLHDYRGKIVVLNFWSAHCAPCIAEMPSLVKLQKRMGDKITVVGVAVDTTNDEYHAFLQKHGIDFLTVLDTAKNSYNLYGATGYPETTIIDRNGMARRKYVFAMDWTNPDIVDYLQSL